jgi:hypothetical protein
MEDGVEGEATPTCDGCETANGEMVRVSASGDLDDSDETGENHLREVGIGTDSDPGGRLFSTLVSSGFGGVGGMTFVMGS